MLTQTDYLKLSKIYDNTTATYKFYWMLSLLDIVSEGRSHSTITFDEMVVRMLSKAWEPLKQGRFSFGKCDALIKHVDKLISLSPLNISSIEMRVRYYLMPNTKTRAMRKIISEMTRYVPYRFLYPWTGSCNEKKYVVEALSKKEETRAIYRIDGKTITINPIWREYLVNNAWNLTCATKYLLNCFLQRYNDNLLLATVSEHRHVACGYSATPVYEVPENEGWGMVAETILIKQVLVHKMKCGNLNNVLSQVNINNNIENPKKQ